jgi:hypothetical protein
VGAGGAKSDIKSIVLDAIDLLFCEKWQKKMAKKWRKKTENIAKNLQLIYCYF